MKAVCALLATACMLVACDREKRDFVGPPPTGATTAPASSLRVGLVEPVEAGRAPAGMGDESSAYAVNQGKRLFRWYNCNGCHAAGGGNMGPPLMDAKWLYGATPRAIHASIVEGRPNGMPAYGGRIPQDQVWQLVAYVRSLSGQLPSDVAPSRGDALAGAPPENTRDKEAPVAARPASSPRP